MQLDEKPLDAAVEAFKDMWGQSVNTQMEAAITAYLTALASQEGAQGDAEYFLHAGVSEDAKTVGLWHETSSDRSKIRAAHVSLRDRLNERLSEEDLRTGQEGAQAGEVKQWRHELPGTYLEWSGWYDGEPPRPLSQFSRIRYRTVYTTQPAPDDAVRAAVEAEQERIVAEISSKLWYGNTVNKTISEVIEIVRARKGGAA